MKTHRPAFQFYIGDWKKDPAVICLSLAARGLWFEMLLHMHESKERGYLVHDSGKPITVNQISRMVGATLEEVQQCIAEMETAGTFSLDQRGVIFSRRMVRDNQISLVRSKAGKLGFIAKTDVSGFAQAKRKQNEDFAEAKIDHEVNFCPTKMKNTKTEDSSVEVEGRKKNKDEGKISETSPARIPKLGNPSPLFQEFIGAFLAAGVKLGDQDAYLAAVEFYEFDEAEQESIVEYTKQKALKTEARYMGLPVNMLRKAEWSRKGGTRVLPLPREPSKSEQATVDAMRLFMESKNGH